MANGDHEPASGWRLATSIIGFATAIWGVVRSTRERRPAVGVNDPSVLDLLAMLEKDRMEWRQEAAEWPCQHPRVGQTCGTA